MTFIPRALSQGENDRLRIRIDFHFETAVAMPIGVGIWNSDGSHARYRKGQELGHFVHVVRIHVWKNLRMRKQCVLSAPPPRDEFSLNCSVAHGTCSCDKLLESASYRLSRALPQF